MPSNRTKKKSVLKWEKRNVHVSTAVARQVAEAAIRGLKLKYK